MNKIQDNTRFVRSAGLWCMISALIGIGGGITEVLAPTTWGTPLFAIMQVLALIANALAFVGVIGLARSGMVGEGRLWQITFLLLGLALYQQGTAPSFKATTVGA